jgi:acetyl esterase/lipase
MIFSEFSSKDISSRLPQPSAMRLRGYCADDAFGRRRPAILFLPGGGYEVNSPTEGEPAALEFLSRGFQGFVLDYSLKPAKFPQQLLEAASSIAFIRDNAEKFGVDPEKVYVCGFSAGGHLAGCLANLWHEAFIAGTLGGEPERYAPNGAVLCYPVITARYGGMSFENLDVLGTSSEDLVSLEKSVSDMTPPCFIWHTFNDNMVPVEHSLLFAKALQEQGRPFELHIFHDGPHAMSVCTAQTARNERGINPHAGQWVELCAQWLREI